MDSSPEADWIHVRLPAPLSYLPSIFRFLSLAYIAPIILLSIIDVGGYLLFKLFYKPFGNYPMYSYFKQAPPREDGDSEPNSPRMKGTTTVGGRGECTSSSSEASSTLSSPAIPPTITLDSAVFDSPDEDGDRPRPAPLPARRTSSLRRRGSKKTKKSAPGEAHRHLIGFEGPMLDFKSPTASDYEE